MCKVFGIKRSVVPPEPVGSEYNTRNGNVIQGTDVAYSQTKYPNGKITKKVYKRLQLLGFMPTAAIYQYVSIISTKQPFQTLTVKFSYLCSL